MADKLKDAEDRLLETMFRSEPLDDAGFSDGVVRKIRRRLWLRRLALPVAVLIGGSIAFKPLTGLAIAAGKLLAVVPQDLFAIPVSWTSQVPILVTGGALVMAAVVAARLLED